MNPIVQAALIAGGTTAIVGIAGFWSTVHVTGRQIRSGQDAKLWDERAAVYIDVLTVLDFLHVRTYDQSQDYEPEWDRLEARLAVFGSAAVFSAMQASRKAHEQLDLATAQHSNERLEHTFQAAEAADNRLIELVRTELHGKSVPLPDVKEQS